MILDCTCNYCGYKFKFEPKSWMGSYNLKCIKCGDKNIKTKEVNIETGDIFGYRFDPPFEKKKDVAKNNYDGDDDDDDGFLNSANYWHNGSD